MLCILSQESGADCVKFQKSHLESRFTKERLNQQYTNCNSFGYNYKAHREKLELSEETFLDLKNYALSLGIHFAASGMDKVHLFCL